MKYLYGSIVVFVCAYFWKTFLEEERMKKLGENSNLVRVFFKYFPVLFIVIGSVLFIVFVGWGIMNLFGHNPDL
ncbi:MAG: hypothetical protein A2231_02860 [Candidatus Firestonebacteria bacterium RIFOXYA2_FULL_40_8]|nr:MAG: hypothetical protein A2231_02860 [Candidatus Firestonebacteria bacterium RIFOXYA2_FULL_40_8]